MKVLSANSQHHICHFKACEIVNKFEVQTCVAYDVSDQKMRLPKFQLRQARFIATHTNKCGQLICVTVGYARKSSARPCNVYVVCAVCFIVYPLKCIA